MITDSIGLIENSIGMITDRIGLINDTKDTKYTVSGRKKRSRGRQGQQVPKFPTIYNEEFTSIHRQASSGS